ncbi:MAG: FRG domain-containing protein [Phycisphaerales bacterium]|nr:FRG domain-containing protein [Planctomycetota bacterium]
MKYIVTNFPELMTSLFHAKASRGHVRLAWRGQADAAWKLETTLHRVVRERSLVERRWELTINNEFMADAPGMSSSTPSRREAANWLVVMRHHGLPSRLLDWTWNPLVAAYFAVCGQTDKDAALWAVDVGQLNLTYGADWGLGSLYADEDPLKALVHAPFSGKEPPKAVFAVAAPHATRRITAQQGLFTIHGIPDPLENIVALEKHLDRILIPASAKSGLLNDLGYLGMSRSHLMVDLDSLALDIANAGRAPICK